MERHNKQCAHIHVSLVNKKMKTLGKENDDLKKTVANLQGENEDLKKTVGDLQKTMDTLKGEFEVMKKDAEERKSAPDPSWHMGGPPPINTDFRWDKTVNSHLQLRFSSLSSLSLSQRDKQNTEIKERD